MTTQSQITGAEQLSLPVAKTFLRCAPGSAENELIETLITAAREYCENITGRSLIAREVKATIDGAYTDHVLLPQPPVNRIRRVTVYDMDGTAHVLDAELYAIEDAESGLVSFGILPSKAVKKTVIEYDAGYELLPSLIKQAELMLLGHMYTNRESVVVGANASVDVSMTTNDLLKQYKVWWF